MLTASLYGLSPGPTCYLARGRRVYTRAHLAPTCCLPQLNVFSHAGRAGPDNGRIPKWQTGLSIIGSVLHLSTNHLPRGYRALCFGTWTLRCPLPPFSFYVTFHLGESSKCLQCLIDSAISEPGLPVNRWCQAGGSGAQLSGFKPSLCLLELCDDLASQSLSLLVCQMEKIGGPISRAVVRIKGDGGARSV